MCGIFGAVRVDSHPLCDPTLVSQMGVTVKHRGPDGQGLFESQTAILGATRLRVRDLRAAGDQPFSDPTGRYWLACNGEIYDAARWRARYPDYPYRTRSDIEPLLAAIHHRGLRVLTDIDGMFAIALWDRHEERLTLVRDRAGEKPLFYAQLGGEVWFASEIQALLRHPRVSHELDPAGLDDLFTIGYILEPRSPFTAIRRIPAGTIVNFAAAGIEEIRFWNPVAQAKAPERRRDPIRQLDRLLQRAVARQLVADVPMGVFVSGGVDSSLLAAMAVKTLGPSRVAMFSVGFSAKSFDESAHAQRLSRHLGTTCHVVRADEDDLRTALDAVTASVAEPITDPAVLPTFLLARMARHHVTTVLSGEGADELFGGYPTYLGHRYGARYAAAPPLLRQALTQVSKLLPVSHGKVPVSWMLRRFLAADAQPWHERHVTWFGTGLRTSQEIGLWLQRRARFWEGLPDDPVSAATLFDYQTYLRDGLLVKLDRATMLNSLEARAPYLDRSVTRFALGLPSELKVRSLTTKWLLKQVASRWLPARHVHRRKRGLSVPISSWLNGGLRGEVDRLLAPTQLPEASGLRPERIAALVSQHRRAEADHGRALWTLLIFQRWCERWLGGQP